MTEAAGALAVEVVKGNPAERLLVISPNYRAFDRWCRENDINPRAGNVKCVLSDQHLRGYSNTWYVYLATPDSHEGRVLFETYQRMKITHGLKNAYAPQ